MLIIRAAGRVRQPAPGTVNPEVYGIVEGAPVVALAVNRMTTYFVNYNLKKDWYPSSSPIIRANWEATSGNVWVVSFGGGVGRIMKVGYLPENRTVQFYGNAAYPADGSPWGMRLQLVFLFPTQKH